MPHDLLIAILTGLGGMLGWGFADFFAKKTIDRIGDVTTLFWGQLVGILPLLILFAFHPVAPHLSNLGWLFLILLGVWSGLSYIPTYVAFGKGKVSLLSPLFATNAVLVAILSAAFFGEIIPFGRVLAFVVVFVGVLLINGDPRDLWLLITGKMKAAEHHIHGLKEIFLAVILYSLWLLALDRFIIGMDWVPILLGIRIFSTIALFVYIHTTDRKIIFFDRSLWKFIALISFFDVGAFAFVSYGFSATMHPSIIAMLSGAFSLPTIILGRIFLNEKSTRVQAIGSIVVIMGIMLLALI